MEIGLFGGTFDPPHLAHLIIAETVCDQFGLDQILWMPSGQPPHKTGGELTPAASRLAMTRLAIRDNEAFAVSTLEMERDGPSYTVDTLRVLQDRHPNASFALIIGGDSLADFHTWHRPEEIASRAPLIVYDRPQATPPESERLVQEARFAEAPRLAISSTGIRNRCRDGRSIRYLVSEPVRRYIQEENLYRS